MVLCWEPNLNANGQIMMENDARETSWEDLKEGVENFGSKEGERKL